MKKIILSLFFLLTCAAPELFALRPGDTADGSIGKLQWLNTLPVKLGKLDKEEAAVAPALRGVVFVLTRNRNSELAVSALESCRRKHFRQLQIAVISPDPAEEVKAFAARHRETRLRFAVDTQRNLTPYYMAGNPLFPLGFLMDKAGVILWCGEAVDMPEAVERYFAGKLNAGDEKKISKLTDELHQRLRANELRAMKRCAEAIFKLQPGHPTALRMTLFALESSGKITEAWELIQRESSASPKLLRLYFTALDMLRRHPQLQKELPAVAKNFFNHARSAADTLAFTGYLLQYFPENGDALRLVHQRLLGKRPLHAPTAADQPAAALQKARLFHQTGNLKAAIEYAGLARNLFMTNHNSAGQKYAENLLKYYKTLAELAETIY